MLVNFSVVPLGEGVSMSGGVSEIIDMIDKSGLEYRMHSMGTVVEGGWDEVMGLVKQCHNAMHASSGRVYTTITIDDRKGASGRIDGKVRAVEEKLGHEVKK
jgi:uncharacterized protein (TIGR00106 family)